MTRPSDDPIVIAVENLFGSGSFAASATKAAMTAAFLARGFFPKVRPPVDLLNAVLNNHGRWLAHLDEKPFCLEVTANSSLDLSAYGWARYGRIIASASGGGGGGGNVSVGGGGGGSGAVGGFDFKIAGLPSSTINFSGGGGGGGGVGGADGATGGNLTISSDGDELLFLSGGWGGIGGTSGGNGNRGRNGGGGGSSSTGPGGNGGHSGNAGIDAGTGGTGGQGTWSDLLNVRDWGDDDIFMSIKEEVAGGTGPQGGGGGGQGVWGPTDSLPASALAGEDSAGSLGGQPGRYWGGGGGGGGGGTDPGDGGKGADWIAIVTLF